MVFSCISGQIHFSAAFSLDCEWTHDWVLNTNCRHHIGRTFIRQKKGEAETKRPAGANNPRLGRRYADADDDANHAGIQGQNWGMGTEWTCRLPQAIQQSLVHYHREYSHNVINCHFVSSFRILCLNFIDQIYLIFLSFASYFNYSWALFYFSYSWLNVYI